MVQIKEFRILMPMTMEEYEIGISYTVMKMEQQNTNSQEGVEIVENRPFEDELLGKGQFTSKIYHLQSKIPSWLKTFAPPNALIVMEESWCAYPKSKTVIKCPFFNKCSLTIETVNIADNGSSENVHGLNKEQLAIRQVEYLDISSISKDYWSRIIGANNIDLTNFKSQKTGRGPLQNGWKDSCKPMATTYKLVTMEAPIWGLGERLEDLLISGERALFLACHRLCFAWIDEWFGMTMDQITEMEKEKDLMLQKVCFINQLISVPLSFEQKCQNLPSSFLHLLEANQVLLQWLLCAADVPLENRKIETSFV
ncbi:hypothetical protein LUZ62_029445 [Rhynchospora pubera]|uniref:Phosphatidylinositol transfer protein N-terminal domain-containing protein n=1 Tax=Rhynchospora pubera TaxID=906938 RepID=A0AAV8HJQ6_9POAL|nr:hypothetical protein LUZ62_029445 [Rhynchospora pubera]